MGVGKIHPQEEEHTVWRREIRSIKAKQELIIKNKEQQSKD